LNAKGRRREGLVWLSPRAATTTVLAARRRGYPAMPDAFTWIGLFTRREATSRGCGEGGSGGWLWVCSSRLRAFAFILTGTSNRS
jgi:hypothetical protein